MNRFAVFGSLFVVACSGSQTPPGGGIATPPVGETDGGAGNGSTSVDAGKGGGGTPVQDAATAMDSGAVPPSGDSGAPIGSDAGVADCDAALCGQVVGAVQRTSTAPKHGGKGTVYVAVFDGNPITNASTAKIVARALLPNEDMTSATATVAYRIDGVPVRSAAYQVIAFLDDGNTVTASNPTPGSGDLVSLDTNGGFGGVPLTVPTSSTVTLNLPLNVAMP